MAMTFEVKMPGSGEPPDLWRVSKPQYLSMHEQGFFDESRVELVFGMVVAMAPVDQRHVESLETLVELLRAGTTGRARVFGQEAFDATEDSIPVPDIALLPPVKFWDALPRRAFLVVEVSRSSARYDRSTKAKLYGLSDVDEYWIVDHNTRTVVVHRDRAHGDWATVLTFRPGQTLSPAAFPEVAIAVDEILPPQG